MPCGSEDSGLHPRRITRHLGGWFLADTCRVFGEVYLGHDVNVWFGAVIRGDVAAVSVGARTNVQDNAVIHCDAGVPNDIGADVSVGHAAVVHGRRVGDGSLIGMGAVLLKESVVGKGCLVAAGAVVPPGMRVPDGVVVAGVPARVVREVNEADRAYLNRLPPHYLRLARAYAGGLHDLGGRPLDDKPSREDKPPEVK